MMCENWDEDMYIRWFATTSKQEWLELYEKAQDENLLKPADRKYLNRMANLAGSGGKASWKQAIKAKRIMDEMERFEEEDEGIDEIKENASTNTDLHHLTIRMAWHDNKWNGKVCLDPESNEYCIGEHSLLSRRLRENRNIEVEKRMAGIKPILWKDKNKMLATMPPCYWSLNAFSDEALEIEHANPALNQYKNRVDLIKETLPAYSVFTWPFKLSFVRDAEQYEHHGKYFPQDLLESRIEKFQSGFRENETIIFLYANYDNPISGEEQKYLVLGCALLKERGKKKYFNIPENILNEIRQKRYGAKNFPTVNWALRYTLDYPDNGVLLPYHEYLHLCEKIDDNEQELIQEIKVTIDEPELLNGFKYVAMAIDEDQAIYILFKMRKSILVIREHERDKIVRNIAFDSESALAKIDEMIRKTWQRRGYFPGFAKFSRALLKIKDADEKCLDELIPKCKRKEPDDYPKLITNMLNNPEKLDDAFTEYEDILCELSDKINEYNLTTGEFLLISCLNLTRRQFDRIINPKEYTPAIKSIAQNPFLLYEDYEPGKDTENKLTGAKIDDSIDLQKIDIALFPKRKYLKPFRQIQNIREDDPRRVRALVMHELGLLENNGHCFEEGNLIRENLEKYPLFYKDEEYQINVDFRNLDEKYTSHFQEKLVIKKDTDNKHVYYYLKDIYEAEESIKNSIQTILSLNSLSNIDFNMQNQIDESIKTLQSKGKLNNDKDERIFKTERKKLYQTIYISRFYVLSGSPGTGKSFELLRFINNIRENNEKYILLAPTGKATLRLKNNKDGFENIQAVTIDKYLTEKAQTKPGTIEAENIIIDEMSMVDLVKFEKLLSLFNFRSNQFKRLVLVGDPNQLPPIGYGKIFQDVIQYLKSEPEYSINNYIYLTINLRTLLDSDYLKFIRVFTGENKNYEQLFFKISSTKNLGENCQFYFWKNKEQLREQILECFERLYSNFHTEDKTEFIDNVFSLDFSGKKEEKFKAFSEKQKLDRFQMITPYRSGYAGALGLNNFFQKKYRDNNKSLHIKELLFKMGDKIIRTENYYQYDNWRRKKLVLSNGSIGSIGMDKHLYFPESEKLFSKNDFKDDNFLLAYAITVHKAQGSGFDNVFVIIPSRLGLLSRELLYTALTRAKESIYIFVYQDGKINQDETLFGKIRKKTATAKRRTSLFLEPHYGYTYLPKDGVSVKSRVEYIIYKKLEEAKNNNIIKDFAYEAKYELNDRPYDIHPDFSIELESGRRIYWEHLGMITEYGYRTDWQERYLIYKENGELENLVTTDEKKGISDTKIEQIIRDIASGNLAGEKNNAVYSKCHYSLF